MNRLSFSTIVELNRLGFKQILEKAIDEDSYFYVFYNETNSFVINITNSLKEAKDLWLVTVFNRGDNCSYDLNTIEGISLDKLGRAQFNSESSIVLFIKKLLNQIKKDRGETIEEELEEGKEQKQEVLIEEDKDEEFREKTNDPMMEKEYQPPMDKENSIYYTKEELKYIFDNSLYHFEILELYNEYDNSGCEILSSIVTTTNTFKHMYYNLDDGIKSDYSIYPNINEPKKDIYTEEEVLNELRKLPEKLYFDLFERSIFYHRKLPSKWIDSILKIKGSPGELKEFVHKYPALIEDSARYGFERMVKIFIDAGIDMSLNKYDNSKDYALHLAAENGHSKVVKMLLDIGMQINDVIAFVGAQSGSTEVVKLAIAAGADYSTGYAGTSIIKAVEDGNVGMTNVLLEAGADPTIEGYKLFNVAYKKGRVKANTNYRKIYELLELYNKKRILKEYSKDISGEKEIESDSELEEVTKKN